MIQEIIELHIVIVLEIIFPLVTIIIKDILDNFDKLVKAIKAADNLPVSKHKVCLDAEIASLQIQVLLSETNLKS